MEDFAKIGNSIPQCEYKTFCYNSLPHPEKFSYTGNESSVRLRLLYSEGSGLSQALAPGLPLRGKYLRKRDKAPSAKRRGAARTCGTSLWL
jgi:hypothetical protein